MKARENSVWKGHGWSYWTAGGRDSFITSFSEVKMGCHIIFFTTRYTILQPQTIREWSPNPSSIIIIIIDISMSHHFLPQILFVLLDCAVVQSWVLQDHVLPRVAILSGGRSHIIRLGLDCD